jgi:hypothetical protein
MPQMHGPEAVSELCGKNCQLFTGFFGFVYLLPGIDRSEPVAISTTANICQYQRSVDLQIDNDFNTWRASGYSQRIG